MGRKPSQVVNAEVNQLRRHLESPNNRQKSDLQNIEELQIKPATYYRYKQRIKQQNIAAWNEIAKESQEEALLKIKKALDYTLGIYTDVADNSPDHKARIAAAQQIIQNSVWYLRLLEKGPKIMPKLEVKLIEQTEAMEPVRNSTV